MKKIITTVFAFLLLSLPVNAEITHTENGDFIGTTSVTGYTKVEEQEIFGDKYQIESLVITAYQDQTLKTEIQNLYERGNGLVGFDQENYSLNLGCLDRENQKINSGNYEITGNDYWLATTSQKTAPISVDLSFDVAPGIDGPCLAHPKTVDIHEWEGYPYGQYELTGYYKAQQDELFGEIYNQGYFVVTSSDKSELINYVAAQVEGGNTVNKQDPETNYFQLGLGCYDEDSVGTSWFEIKDEAYYQLINSRPDSQTNLIVTIGALPTISGGCLSHASKAELALTFINPNDFKDVPMNHLNYTAISTLKKLGIVHGNPDGTFKPNTAINRAELVKLIVETSLKEGETLENQTTDCFKDVPQDEWFAPFVCYAADKGWINGYEDGTFKPSKSTNRAEAMKIILNAFFDGEENIPGLSSNQINNTVFPQDIQDESWYRKFAQYAMGKNLLDLTHLNNDSTKLLHVDQDMFRKEVAEMLYRLIISPDNNVIDATQTYAKENMGFTIHIESVEISQEKPEFAKVTINSTETVTDPATLWLKKSPEEGAWKVIIEPTTSVEESVFEENQIPTDIRF